MTVGRCVVGALERLTPGGRLWRSVSRAATGRVSLMRDYGLLTGVLAMRKISVLLLAWIS
jgi:hypothetical protein